MAETPDKTAKQTSPTRYSSKMAETPDKTAKQTSATRCSSVRETIGVYPLLIKGYSQVKGMGVGKHIACKEFTVGGYKWVTYFYPDGKDPEDYSTYVSLFIVLASEATNVRARLELHLMDQSEKQEHLHFESGPYTLNYRGSMWGFNRFFRRDMLETSCYLRDDCLKINSTVRVEVPDIGRSCFQPGSSLVKVMEKYSCVMVVDEYSRRIGKGMGNLIESSPFVVGRSGFSFSIQLYPDGADLESHYWEHVSLFIKNLSSKTAHLVVDLHITNRIYEHDRDLDTPAPPGFSSFHDREVYHQVDIVEPGHRCGRKLFYPRWLLMDKYRSNSSLMLRATIGLVSYHNHPLLPLPLPQHSIGLVSYHNHPLLPLSQHSSSAESCILFEVEGRLYYAQESIITTRCPALLQDYSHSGHVVLISDVESHVFEAVLWFLHNNKLHEQDRKAIAKNRKDFFSQKMIAAADKFKLKDLKRQCESFLYYGDSEVLRCYYQVEYNVKGLWENLSQKMEELIPQNMKAD